uniref:Uncharacterized protein n=1 Tax=Meloidogyne hapla TaxID=6305 RepID=A0A1I8BCZ7_MELHA
MKFFNEGKKFSAIVCESLNDSDGPRLYYSIMH